MSERDPRIDPKPGDVLRRVMDGSDVVVVCVVHDVVDSDVHGYLVFSDDSPTERWSLDDWAKWSGVDGVQVLYRAEEPCT
jgi:hypothetical protein